MTENEEKNQTTLPSAQDDLPIGRDTEFILKEWIRIQKDIPKISRYTVVPLLLKTLAAMVSDVYFANALKTERKSSADLCYQEKPVRHNTNGHQKENDMRRHEEICITTSAGVFVQREENGVLTAEWKNINPIKK